MPEVYIESLTVRNFGPFYGEHTFNFTTDENRCGILIGGRNGAGKTHLLRALYLGVVGETGVYDLKKVETSAEATRFIFEKSLNRLAASRGEDTAVIKVVISQRDEKGCRRAKFVREIRYRLNSNPVWRSSAELSDGSDLIEDDKRIEAIRDTMLPRHLARFFFFDAERGQNFSLSQQDIIEGITRILGLWSYQELETDLRTLIQQRIARNYNSSRSHEVAGKLADITGQIVAAEKKYISYKEELNDLKVELNETKEKLAKVEARLKDFGVVHPDELERVNRESIKLTEIKARLETEVSNAWDTAIPLALLGKYRKELHDYLEREEKRRTWEQSKNAIEPKIPQVKVEVFGNVPNEYKLEEDLLAFYIDRLERALHRLFHPPPEGMADSVYVTDGNDRSAQIRARLASGTNPIQGISQIFAELETCDANLRNLETRLRQLRQQGVAAIEQGQQLHDERAQLTVQLKKLEERKIELEREIHFLTERLKELKREESNLTAEAKKAQQWRSLNSLAVRYREAASEIRARAADQLRRQISKHLGDLWVEIVERQREFRGMEFDENWNCYLLCKDGKKVPWDEINTSAGQRQVRMLAFYESLRRLAKLSPPLVVDTPLGRLDNEVRDSVLDKLYLVGHQTVIMTTNSEIDPDGNLFDRIRNKISRAYTLYPSEHEESENYVVKVEPHYFGKNI